MSAPPTTAGDRLHLRGLDGLRCLSVMFVVLTHLGAFGPYAHAFERSDFGSRLVSLVHGITGVSTFFVISGFLITTLLLREQARNGRIDLKAFYARRFLRIVPCYAVFLAVLVALTVLGHLRISKEAFLYAGLYATNFVPRLHYYGELGHTWSLAVEEHFYLLWPICMALIGARALIAGLLSMIAVCTVLYGAFVFATPLRASFYPEYWTLPAALGIFVGCLLACVRNDAKIAERLRRAIGGVRAWWLAAALYASPLWLPQALLHAVLLLQDLGVALAVWAIVETPSARIVAALELAPVRYVGKISYSIYVWQGLFLRTGPAAGPWYQQPPQNLVLTAVAAVLSYHLIEQPFLAMKRRFAR